MDPHLYQALRKSIYKPASFFKGIIIPLCEVHTQFIQIYWINNLERRFYTERGQYYFQYTK
jgi:hypothetical protein